MKNSTNIKIPKKYQPYITEVWYEGQEDGYWADLLECCICDDTETHFVHEWTQKDFLKSLQSIRLLTEEQYINHFGDDDIEDFRKDLESLKKVD